MYEREKNHRNTHLKIREIYVTKIEKYMLQNQRNTIKKESAGTAV